MSKGYHKDNARNDLETWEGTWVMLPWFMKISVIISLVICFIYVLAVLIGLIGVLL